MRTYHLETDASINPGRRRAGLPFAGGGIVLRNPDLELTTARSVVLGYLPSATHAEYAALVHGLEVALGEGARAIRIRTDNWAIVQQYSGTWKARSTGIPELLARVRELAGRFESFDLRWASSSHSLTRADGAPTADSLARQAAGLGRR